jgi:hypothetical protein
MLMECNFIDITTNDSGGAIYLDGSENTFFIEC